MHYFSVSEAKESAAGILGRMEAYQLLTSQCSGPDPRLYSPETAVHRTDPATTTVGYRQPESSAIHSRCHGFRLDDGGRDYF